MRAVLVNADGSTRLCEELEAPTPRIEVSLPWQKENGHYRIRSYRLKGAMVADQMFLYVEEEHER